MVGSHSASRLFAPSVQGLESGRERARRSAARRRVKNSIVSGVAYAIVLGGIGGASYFLWQYYDSQDDTGPGDGPAVDRRSTSQLIEDLEDQPRWNGPGAPAFGIDDDQP